MQVGTKRAAWVALIAGFVAGDYAGFSFARFMSGWQTNGPPALHRLPVSAPTARLRYSASPQELADPRMPGGEGPFPIAVVIPGGSFLAKIDVKADIAPVADALTKDDIATLNIENRKLGDAVACWPSAYLDIGTAVDLIRGIARN